MPICSWALSAFDLVSIVVLLSEMRRDAGKRCLCLRPYAPDSSDVRRELALRGVAWFTLVHDSFQIIFASISTASQVASPADCSLGSAFRRQRPSARSLPPINASRN